MGVIDVLLAFVTQLLSQPTILIGLFALVGLIIQKKPVTVIITGTIKTIMGFALIGAGAGVLINSIAPLNELMQGAFNLSGTLPVNEAAYAAASSEFGSMLAGIMALGMASNIILAKFSNFKFIYLTGHEVMWISTVCAIVLSFFNLQIWQTILIGGLMTGLYMAISPALIYKTVCKVTGTKDLAIGHSGITFYFFAALFAKLFGNKEKSAEEINIPKSFNFLRDLSVSLTVAMVVVYLGVLVGARMVNFELYTQTLGGVNMLIFAIMRSVEFAAAIYIIQAGVRMVVAELIPAFQGVANKLIPNAVPALDIPILYPYQPNSALIGFIVSAVASIIVFFIQVALVNTPFELPIILPTLFTAFFYGATYGCVCNVEGGLKGTIIGAFLATFVSSLSPAVLIKFGGVLINGTTFGGGDSAVMGVFLNQLGKILPPVGLLVAAIALFLIPIIHANISKK